MILGRAIVAQTGWRRSPGGVPFVAGTLYASPDGTGSGADAAHPTTITTAQELARLWALVHGSATVVRLPGDYIRTSPFIFDNRDSNITWTEQTAGTTRLTSNVNLTTGWVQIDGVHDVWQKTFAGPLAYAPHKLIVDGTPAEIAHSPQREAGWTVGYAVVGGAGRLTGTITAPDTSYSTIANPTALRVRLSSTNGTWREAILRVTSIVGATITLDASDVAAANAYSNQINSDVGFDRFEWVEGIPELVAQRAGSFSTFRNNDGSITVTLKPAPGVVMNTTSIEMPTWDISDGPLLDVAGTTTAPVVNFSWGGDVDGAFWSGVDRHGYIVHGDITLSIGADATKEASFATIPGMFRLRFAQGCTVTAHVTNSGGCGLWLDDGAQGCTIFGAAIDRCDAAGLRVGEEIRTVLSSHPSDPNAVIENNVIRDSVIVNNAWRFRGSSQCSTYFYADCTFLRVTTGVGPYTAFICARGGGACDPPNGHPGVGFGVGFPDPSLVPGGVWSTPSCVTGNTYSALLCEGACLQLQDGACFYTNGDGNDTISSCCVRNAQGSGGHGYYNDNGARSKTFTSCVGSSVGGVVWNFQTGNPKALSDTVASSCYAMTAHAVEVSSPLDASITYSGTSGTSWTSAALAIVGGAGVGAGAYADLRKANVALAIYSRPFASSYTVGFDPSQAFDGDWTQTYWIPDTGDTAPSLGTDFGVQMRLTGVTLVLGPIGDDTASKRSNFQIQGANAADFSDAVILYTQGSTPLERQRPVVLRGARMGDSLGSFRFLRVLKTDSNAFQVMQLEAHGWPVDTALLPGSIDYTALPVGPMVTPLNSRILPKGGGAYSRTTPVHVQTSATTMQSIGSDAGMIGQLGSDATLRGFYFNGASAHMIGYRGADVSTFGGGGSSDTGSYVAKTGPDGSNNATLMVVASGGWGKFQGVTLAANTDACVRVWVQVDDDATKQYKTELFGGTARNVSSAAPLPSPWTPLYGTPFNTGSTTSYSLFSADTRALGGDALNGTWPAAIKSRIDYEQIEQRPGGEFSFCWASSGLVGARDRDANARYRVSNGTLKFRLDMILDFSAAHMSVARYVMCNSVSPTVDNVKVDTDGTVTVTVGSTSIALPTKIPITWAWTGHVQLDITMGNGHPTGSVTIDGTTTSLGSGAGTHAAISISSIDWGSYNDNTGHWSGLVLRHYYYA